METNLLINPSFEQRDWSDTPQGQIPPGWLFHWYEGIPNDIDPNHHAWVAPEIKHVEKWQVPPHEHGLFWWHGDLTLKIFKGSGAVWFRLYQPQAITEPGSYRLLVPVYPDAVAAYNPDGTKDPATDPLSGRIRLAILSRVDGWRFGGWQSMHPYLERQEWAFPFEAREGDVGAGAEFQFPHPLANSGVFTDAWQLTRRAPEHVDGFPREDYARHYVLLPQDVTLEQKLQVVKDTFAERVTIGHSADDAGIGPGLTHRYIYLLGRHFSDRKEVYEDFFNQWYPGATRNYGLLPGEGDAPPNGAGRPEVRGWLGIHQLIRQPDGMAELQGTGPSLFKAVDRSDQIVAAMRMAPPWSDGWYAFRKWHPDEGGASFRYNPNPELAGEAWVKYVADPVTADLRKAGLPTDRVAICSINEAWDYDMVNNRHTLAFDFAALAALQRYNKANSTQYRFVAASMAVGNPALPSENEAQWQEILPFARALSDAGGWFDYHGYGFCDPQHPEYLEEFGPYLQDRWIAYYDWLKAHGVIVPWALLEGGHVGGTVATATAADALANTAMQAGFYTVATPRGFVMLQKRRHLPVNSTASATGDMWLNPGQGWKGLISVERAVAELLEYFDWPIEKKNKAEGYKASVGGTPFQGGNTWDWGKFDLQGTPYRALAQAYVEVYARPSMV